MEQIELLKKLLKQNQKVSDWKIKIRKVIKNNLYVSLDSEEDFLTSERFNIDLTIYRRYNGKLGECTTTLTHFDETYLQQKINDALVVCSNTKKKAYKLPEKQEIPKVKIADPIIVSAVKKGTINKNIRKLSSEFMQNFKRAKGVKLNGHEIFCEYVQLNIMNSNGLDISTEGTKMYAELVITANKGKNEQEYVPRILARRLKDIDVKALSKKYINYAKDILKSKKPKEFKGAVVLSQDALEEFFSPAQSPNPLVVHCSAKLKFLGMSRYEKNKIITFPMNDKIDLVNDPLVDYNIASIPFDADGIPAKKLKLWDNSVFKEYIAQKKYADYIKEKPSGPLGVINIEPGTAKSKELFKGRVYEIVAFSSFVPNDLSGDFAAEIRLGYVHFRGKKTPFKGGMFIGNVFNLVSRIILSKDQITGPGYIGPNHVRFEEAHISGD